MPDSFYAQTLARQQRPPQANDGLQQNQLPGYNSNPTPHGVPTFYMNGQQTTPQNYFSYQQSLPQNIAYQQSLQQLPQMQVTPIVNNPSQSNFMHSQLPPAAMQPVQQFNPQALRPGYSIYGG